jgi:ABC-type transport system involved in multi-copper enzyme maturation permease subunit
MFNVVKAELRKLRRPTLFLGTMGAVVFFSGLFSALLYLLIDSPQGNADRGQAISREVLSLASGGVQGFSSVGGFLGIIALCVFAAQTAQEYTYGTLRNLLIRQPSRMKILAGKLIIDDDLCPRHDCLVCHRQSWNFCNFGTYCGCLNRFVVFKCWN